MKKVLWLLLFFSAAIHAQSTNKVLELLFANKRAEARKLFDKDLKGNIGKNIDVLVLDAMLSVELGKVNFDERFAQQFSSFPESRYYLDALIQQPMLMNQFEENGFDSSLEKRIDVMAALPNLMQHPAVQYYKAVSDRNQRKFNEFRQDIAQINHIVPWQRCGVFENLNGSGMETPYEPETYARDDKKFNGNSNGTLGWYNPAVRPDEIYEMFENEAQYGEGIMYLQTFVDNPQAQEVYLNLGSAEAFRIFVNDVELFGEDKAGRSDVNAYRCRFRLPTGTNRLLVKLSVGTVTDYFTANFTDITGKPIANLRFDNHFKPYTASTLSELSPLPMPTESEQFFADRIGGSQ